MEVSSRAAVAVASVAACGPMAVAAVVLEARADLNMGGASLLALLFLTYAALGGVLVSDRTSQALGVLLIVAALGSLGGKVATDLDGPDLTLHARSWLSLAADVGWWLGPPLVPFILLLFPNGQLPSRRWRPVVVVGAVGYGLHGVANVFGPGNVDHEPPLPNPLGIGAIDGLTNLAGAVGLFTFPAMSVVALVGLVVRWRATRKAGRQPLLVAVGFLTAAALSLLIARLGHRSDSSWPVQVGLGFAYLSLPAGLVVAILGRRDFELRRATNRVVAHLLTTVILGVAYVAVVIGVSSALPGGRRTPSLLAATALLAVAFAPVRAWAQRACDRYLYGDRADPAGAIARLAQSLDRAEPETEPLDNVAELVARATGAAYVEIEDAARDHRGRFGHEAEPQLSWPLTSRRQEVGVLRLAGLAHSAQPEAARLVKELLPVVAVTVDAVISAAASDAARADLAAAVADERRRIRRDLHDGVGPTLAAVVLGLEAMENSCAPDDERTRRRIQLLREETSGAYDDLRTLVRGLRPSVLDEVGLVRALRARASRMQYDRLRIEIRAEPGADADLPAGIEEAAFFIAAEAMNNVVRHAHAQRCTVEIRRDDALHVQVVDDGRGFGPGVEGTGLRSMRERAEAVCGRLDLSSEAGRGTCVEALLGLGAR